MGDKENLLLTELDEDCPPEDEVFEEKKDEKVYCQAPVQSPVPLDPIPNPKQLQGRANNLAINLGAKLKLFISSF